VIEALCEEICAERGERGERGEVGAAGCGAGDDAGTLILGGGRLGVGEEVNDEGARGSIRSTVTGVVGAATVVVVVVVVDEEIEI